MIYSLLMLGFGACLFVTGVIAIVDAMVTTNIVSTSSDTTVELPGSILPGAFVSSLGVWLMILGTVNLMMAR